jgi:hypothetical protein
MIIFENEGPIDIRSIKTFGVNSKANKKSAIGYFGTGLKYAIAILLRNDHQVSIYSEGVNYEFAVAKTKIRNDDFDIVTMNGEELGFTTELGKDWEMWMAFREIYSNMLDEGGHAYNANITEYKEGRTYVVVQGTIMENLYLDRDKYFLNRDKYQPIADDGECAAYKRMHPGEMGSVYFKGVRVMETRLPALYDYDHALGLTLTEDRTIRDSWSTLWHTASLVARSQDKNFIKELVMAPDGSYESRLNFRHASGSMQVFLDTVGELRKRYKDIGINHSAIEMHKQHRKTPHVMPGISCYLNTIETKQWDKAQLFCKEALGLDLDAYRMIVCEDIGKKGVMGLANIEEGIIYISKLAFRKGTKAVAVALLEEFTHVHHEVEDETLQQKWVYLDQIIGLGEQLSGEPL